MAVSPIVGIQSPLPGVALSPQGSPTPATLPNVTPGPVTPLTTPLPGAVLSSQLAPVTPNTLTAGPVLFLILDVFSASGQGTVVTPIIIQVKPVYPNQVGGGSGGGQFAFSF